VVQPIEELAETCVELLLRLIQGEKIEKKDIQLDVALRKGVSTCPFEQERGKK
jgi:DNA-binding LacI/PurR family transcriptional regulator